MLKGRLVAEVDVDLAVTDCSVGIIANLRVREPVTPTSCGGGVRAFVGVDPIVR